MSENIYEIAERVATMVSGDPQPKIDNATNEMTENHSVAIQIATEPVHDRDHTGTNTKTDRNTPGTPIYRIGCLVCLEAFDDFCTIVTLPCGHTLHEFCAKQCFVNHKKCPKCQKPFHKHRMTNIFLDYIGDADVTMIRCERQVIGNLQRQLKNAQDCNKFYRQAIWITAIFVVVLVFVIVVHVGLKPKV